MGHVHNYLETSRNEKRQVFLEKRHFFTNKDESITQKYSVELNILSPKEQKTKKSPSDIRKNTQISCIDIFSKFHPLPFKKVSILTTGHISLILIAPSLYFTNFLILPILLADFNEFTSMPR